MNCYNLDKIENVLNNAHPRQIINTIEDFKVSLYEVKINYKTRNRYRDRILYFILDTLSPEKDLSKEVNEWVANYNSKYEHRKLLNVQILSSQCLGFISI